MSSFSQQFFYGLGHLPFLYANVALGGHIQFVYTDIFKLDSKSVGLAWSLYSIFNAFIEPTVGVISDNSSISMWNNKRIPWILISFIPWAASFYFIWNPFGGSEMLFWSFLACLLAFGLLNAMVSINWSALFSELFVSDSEKASTSTYKVLFSILGLMGGIVLPPVITNSWKDMRILSLSSFTLVSMGLFAYLSAGGPVVVKQDQTKKSESKGFISNVKIALSSKSFRSFLMFFFVQSFGNAIMTTFLPMCLKYVSKINEPIELWGTEISAVNQNAIILASFYICAIVATKFWSDLASKYSVLAVFKAEIMIYAAILIGMLYIPTGFYPLWICMIFCGLSMSGWMLFPDLIISYVIDEDEILFNQGKRVGLFVGVRQIIFHCANALQGVFGGWLVSYSEYIPGLVEQSDFTVSILRLGLFLPGICFILSGIALFWFPLNPQRLEELRAKKK